MTKSDEFTKGFNLAIDRLLRLGLLHHNFNSTGLVRVEQDVNGNPCVMVEPEEDLDMDVVKAKEFWPLVELEPESEDGISDPPLRTPVREYYPGWMPHLLDAINIRP